MDSSKIISIALAACWIVGMAGAFILKSTHDDIKQMMPRMSVSERRQDTLEKKIESDKAALNRRIENEQAAISKVLESMQQLLSAHDSQLAVIQQRTEKSESERSDMAADIKALLRVSYAMEAKVNTFERTPE